MSDTDGVISKGEYNAGKFHRYMKSYINDIDDDTTIFEIKKTQYLKLIKIIAD